MKGREKQSIRIVDSISYACSNRVNEMCSLSEMEQYVECVAYSRRVRVQTKEKGIAKVLRKEME